MKSFDKKGFVSIVSDHKGILYKVIRSYCKDPDDQKDLEQEILIQVWKSLQYFDGRVKLSTWIYKISLNVAISFYRKDIKRKSRNTLLDESVFSIAEDNNVEIARRERTESLYKFIGQLDEFNKAIIILYLEAYNYKEIAEVVGITETNVATRINRIKGILKNNFSTYHH